MQELSATRSLYEATAVLKEMQLQATELAPVHELGRAALKTVLEERMRTCVHQYLWEANRRGQADRRNGYYRRWLMTSMGAIELAVPRSRANVDLNVHEPRLGTICDIGCVPRLELTGGTFPQPAKGDLQISEREAERLLERRFYPFAELAWLDLPAARAASVASGKPLHVIALFGSLIDESC